MEAVLRVQGLNKHYPGFALEDVSFSLAPNRIMGLIGKNGAGKSTTLKAILNMVSPERGRVTMFGNDFYQHEKACKQRLGVVFGGIDFYPLKSSLPSRRSRENFTRTGMRPSIRPISSGSPWRKGKNSRNCPTA